jgi:membrane protein implicated in regulation of membrane protease activity
MGFKPGEIVAIVIALAVPIIGFAVLVSPGAVAAIYDFVLRADVMPFVFFGGAAIVFAVLSWRVYRRIKPKSRKPEA